jgi:hypothetical protein
MLIEKVIPVLYDLQNKEIINWYSFLLHKHCSAKRVLPDDDQFYIHIYVEVIKDVDIIFIIPLGCLIFVL